MKNTKKLFTGCIIAWAFAATSITAFAASASSAPVKTGVLDKFKTEMLEMKKDNLAAQVKAGTMTQERADAIMKALEENQAICDGIGSAKIGQNAGAKFGSNGTGQGICGANRGQGRGRGQGGGCRNNGVCSYQ